MVLFRPLAEIGLRDLAAYGGKAARLGNALQLGCPILPGIVLSTELYRRFMQHGGLEGEISSILNSMQPTALAHFQAVEWAIRSAFRVRPVPSDVADTLADAWQTMGEQPIAVRSSATREDSFDQSFVGQHATYLNVNSHEAFTNAVLGCWVSLFSAKALSYAQHFRVDLVNSSMAIVLQPMIERTQHGALFTVDPVSGNPDRFILEVNHGTRRGVHRLDPYERAPGENIHWSQLRHYGLLLDEHEDAFQAIEWAIADDQLYLMRVRPVTPVPPYLPIGGLTINETDDPLRLVRAPKDRNQSLRPFSWFHRSRSAQINAARYHYANRLFTAYASREEHYVMGYQYARKLRFASRMHSAPPTGLSQTIRDAEALVAARTPHLQAKAILEDTRPELVTLTETKPPTLRKHQLASRMMRVLDIELSLRTEEALMTDIAQTLADIFGRIHGRLLGHSPGRCQELMASQGDLLSRSRAELKQRAQAQYDDDAAAQKERDATFESLQHLYLGDDPLAEWQDISQLRVDRDAFLADWARYAENARDDDRRMIQTRLKRQEQEEQTALSNLWAPKRRLYSYALDLVRRYLSRVADYEETLRLCLYAELTIVQDVGRRLVAEGLTSHVEDAYLLEHKEILSWLQSSLTRDEIVRQLIERRNLRRRWNRYVPANTLQNASPGRQITDTVQGEHTILYGRPISRGYARGRARVVNNLVEASTILPGEILVCKAPFFEMTPMFKIIGAVISESGGLLDHTGVLAREYAIPAIFGVKRATSEISTGDDVEINGAQGLLVRHSTDAEWATFQD